MAPNYTITCIYSGMVVRWAYLSAAWDIISLVHTSKLFNSMHVHSSQHQKPLEWVIPIHLWKLQENEACTTIVSANIDINA